MSFKEKLNRSELNHLKETTISATLKEFKRNREEQKRVKEMTREEPCFTCRSIAIKLGIE